MGSTSGRICKLIALAPQDIDEPSIPDWWDIDKHSINDTYAQSRADKIAARQLVTLEARSWYWGLAESDRSDRTGYLMPITLLGRRGNYFWQLIDMPPPTGLWLMQTHSWLNSPIAQIRKCAGTHYDPAGLTKPQVSNDRKVLRAIAQHGLKLDEQLRRNAQIADLRTLKASIARLCEQRLLLRSDDGLVGFYRPSESEIDRWQFVNPFQADRSKKRKYHAILSEEAIRVLIVKQVQKNFAVNQSGTSQRQLRGILPCSPRRLAEVLDEMVIRELLAYVPHKKNRYFPKS